MEYKNVEIDFNHNDLFNLMMKAHEQNITLNKLCNKIISDNIKLLEKQIKDNKKKEKKNVGKM